MTREEAITVFKAFMDNPLFSDVHKAAFNIAIHDIKQRHDWDINNLILINKDNYESQEPKAGHYEKHIDHTDCIWYGSDSGCPVTCSQYRDGWNDAMDYIFKNGKGYQLYRHDG